MLGRSHGSPSSWTNGWGLASLERFGWVRLEPHVINQFGVFRPMWISTIMNFNKKVEGTLTVQGADAR